MLELSQGNTYNLTYNITNKDKTAKDLSGTQELKYKLSNKKHTAPLIELVLTDPEVIITNPVNGAITIKIDSTLLNPLKEGAYYHEIWQINALGEPTTLMSENLTIYSKLIKE